MESTSIEIVCHMEFRVEWCVINNNGMFLAACSFMIDAILAIPNKTVIGYAMYNNNNSN